MEKPITMNPGKKAPKERDDQNPDPAQYGPASGSERINEETEQEAADETRPSESGSIEGSKRRPDDGTE